MTLTITGTNDGPVAISDARTIDEDTVLVFAASQLLANDSDIDHLDMLTVTGVAATANTHGSVSLVNGQITYSPVADYNGPASFSYTISDSKGGTASATVNVTVNPVAEANVAPVAQNGSASGNEDETITGTVAATDADGDALVYSIVGDAPTGLTFDPNGTYSFQGPTDFNGQITFTYQANDGIVDSNLATVTINVTPVNDAPLANDLAFMTFETGSITHAFDTTDPDSDAITHLIVAAPADDKGTVVINEDGTFTFDPGHHFDGLAAGAQETVTFTYKASDGTADSETKTVSITVAGESHPPIADDVSATGDEDQVHGIPVTISGLPTQGAINGFFINSPPANGTLYQGSLLPDGTIGANLDFPVLVGEVNPVKAASPKGEPQPFERLLFFVPNNDWNGEASFEYSFRSLAGDIGETATATIHVSPVNDVPVADANSYTVNEDTTLQMRLRVCSRTTRMSTTMRCQPC